MRQAFKMKLLPGQAAEYKRRHDEIWPDLQALLREVGIAAYSIFLDEETLTLFAFQELHEDHRSEILPDHPIVKKWWKYMSDIMETNPDNSPVVEPLSEVFYLGQGNSTY
jgi:L-rhamnose mutarotase